MSFKKMFVVFVFLAVFAIGAYADFQNNTTMTWNVPANRSHTVAYGGSCSPTEFFFDEATETLDSTVDGNAMRILPYNAVQPTGTACQSASVAPITITNTGNIATDIDGNITTVSGFAAADVNIQLKVWMGTGSGCGANGLGGWQFACTVSGANAVTSSACRLYDNSNEGTTGKLVRSLAMNDTNQLCFASDFNSAAGPALSQGSRNYNFRTSNTVAS